VTESGQLDYTRADAYDEELVRANTNKVKLAVKVAQPTPVKLVVVPQPTDFFVENLQCGKVVNRINSACS
jgi:hypothetical protein